MAQRRAPASAVRLEECGVKLTPQRRAIIEVLEGAANHPTAEDVFAAVNRRFPMTSRATVYNTLALLKREGHVRELFKDGVSRFDPNTTRHHHFVCDGCGSVSDIDWETLDCRVLATLPGKAVAETYEVTLRGRCGKCRAAR
jgi:Fur family peroxide stress response transcriptional regulator